MDDDQRRQSLTTIDEDDDDNDDDREANLSLRCEAMIGKGYRIRDEVVE